MKNKMLFMTLVLFLSGCNEKDAQYYYDNPAELKKVVAECETKVKAVTTDEELDKLATDKVCDYAMIAAAGVKTKNLKQAMLEADKVGWKAYLKYYKETKIKQKQEKTHKKKKSAWELYEEDVKRRKAEKQNKS
ncbi:MAG: EexN family lipoprotein [Pasteurella sp.]|nr:EexN family lipoprotein [Pasteurella sp.]